VHPHAAEVVTEQWFEVGARSRVQRVSRTQVREAAETRAANDRPGPWLCAPARDDAFVTRTSGARAPTVTRAAFVARPRQTLLALVAQHALW
jgi:hypothetical protein